MTQPIELANFKPELGKVLVIRFPKNASPNYMSFVSRGLAFLRDMHGFDIPMLVLTEGTDLHVMDKEGLHELGWKLVKVAGEE
jgi:hypothetical protein